MQRMKSFVVVCSSFATVLFLLLVNVSAHDPSAAVYRPGAGARSWTAPARLDRKTLDRARAPRMAAQGQGDAVGKEGRRLFEEETFGGNSRTCLTCHSKVTGTVSPQDAQARFDADPNDPLFVGDGSDNGDGTGGVTRMRTHATILMKIPLHPNVSLKDDPAARFVTLRRGIPTTLNTPALDPVLMLDGRQANLQAQATGAIHDHAENTIDPTPHQLDLIAQFQLTDRFFSSTGLKNLAHGAAAPQLPNGRTASERRGRRFFEDVPPDPDDGFRPGLCSHCHSGPLQNQTNEFAPLFFGLPVATGTRFQDVLVSFFNEANNPLIKFIFTNPDDGSETEIESPDPGRALITGILDGLTTFEHTNAFKISPLRGIRHTAPYFHDNSARTLEDVAAHYARFFEFVTFGFITLTEEDQKDMVAFMKLL